MGMLLVLLGASAHRRSGQDIRLRAEQQTDQALSILPKARQPMELSWSYPVLLSYRGSISNLGIRFGRWSKVRGAATF
jgi:hypothetical protein